MKVLCLTMLTVASSVSMAQFDFSYDASLGTFPDDQGWERRVGLPEQVTATVFGGVLSQSTLPLAVTPCPNPEPGAGRSLFWRILGQPFSFEDGVVFEAELRVLSSQDGACICDRPNSSERSGIRMTLVDSNRQLFSVGLQVGRVALANDAFAYCNGPAVVYAAVDTTSDFRKYRLEVNGPVAVLYVDGEPAASHTGYGNPQAGAGSGILLGDATSWSNSSFEVRSFRVSTGSCNPSDLAIPFGVLDLADVNIFVGAFVSQGPAADLNTDELFDLTDIGLFVGGFTAGCP